MDGVVVNIGRCAWAETDRMFAAFQAQAAVVSAWLHYRTSIAGRSYTVRLYRLRAEILCPALRRGGQGGGVHGWKEPPQPLRQHRRSSDIC